MRLAVSYSRVSTADQAEGYSLRDQDGVCERAAERHGARVAERFVDDDSAKAGATLTESFDRRPGWQALMRYLRDHPATRGGPSLVVFKDYSRFSRHAAAAWSQIFELQLIGVEVQAAEQAIDWASPEYPTILGIYLSMPESENRRRGSNIRRGVRQAHVEGR